jgi:hypothetical protein
MNYSQIYDNLILKAKQESRIRHKGIYYEKHHIIPRCLGGSDNDDNLVLLTAREHFIAHKLLTYIYPHNRGIALAFRYMIYGSNKNQNKFRKLKISSRDYKYVKELISQNGLSDQAKLKVSKFNKGKVLLQKTKDKQSETHLGNKNPMFGKPAWDAVNKIRKKCEYCEIETTLGNYVRWHGEKCKHR